MGILNLNTQRVNIQSKIEEEEKEKLQKQLQEEEELQLQKRKKRKIKGNSRLSFSEDIIDNEAQEEEEPHQSNNIETNGGVRCGKLGKDPTVETSFLPDRCAALSSIFNTYTPFSFICCFVCFPNVWA
jgi:protein FAM50